MHAIAETVSRQRGKTAENGLETANDLYFTKHSVGIYSSQPPPDKWQPLDNAPLQKSIDQEPHTYVDDAYEGEVTIETYTVAYDRDGPKEGYIIARNSAGHRVIANTGKEPDTLDRLLVTLKVADPVGMKGYVEAKDGRSIFKF